MPLTGADISTTVYGLTANYWKIGQLYIDYVNNTGFVNYIGYENETKAFGGKKELKSLEVRLDAADVTGIFGNAVYIENLTDNGKSVIDYIDKLVVSAGKGTILSAGPTANYPSEGA
jgi:hypothetical protein